jgi:hypothetical protein
MDIHDYANKWRDLSRLIAPFADDLHKAEVELMRIRQAYDEKREELSQRLFGCSWEKLEEMIP